MRGNWQRWTMAHEGPFAFKQPGEPIQSLSCESWQLWRICICLAPLIVQFYRKTTTRLEQGVTEIAYNLLEVPDIAIGSGKFENPRLQV